MNRTKDRPRRREDEVEWIRGCRHQIRSYAVGKLCISEMLYLFVGIRSNDGDVEMMLILAEIMYD